MTNEIYHHGIKGMKWGVRRTPEQLGQMSIASRHGGNIVKEGKNIIRSGSNIRRARKQTDLSKMSDKDLRDAVNRMNMEQQYRNLSSNRVSKGRVYTENALDIAGSALTVTASALAIALSIQKLKGDK